MYIIEKYFPNSISYFKMPECFKETNWKKVAAVVVGSALIGGGFGVYRNIQDSKNNSIYVNNNVNNSGVVNLTGHDNSNKPLTTNENNGGSTKVTTANSSTNNNSRFKTFGLNHVAFAVASVGCLYFGFQLKQAYDLNKAIQSNAPFKDQLLGTLSLMRSFASDAYSSASTYLKNRLTQIS